MARKLLIRSASNPFHVTGRCNNKDPFPISLEEVWESFCGIAYWVSTVYGARFHAAVLMPNHFHLVMSVTEFDLGKVMQNFMSLLTIDINRKANRCGRIFGSRYHWSLISNEYYFANVIKYVYRNPVRAGICLCVEEYKFSSLHGLTGSGHLLIPVTPLPDRSTLFPGGLTEIEILDWLNQPFGTEIESGIQRSLRKKIFNVRNRDWRRKLSVLKTDFQ